jgi:hypothetical protein
LLRRVLSSRGADLNDLADSVELLAKGHVSKEEVEALYLEAYEKGAEEERQRLQQANIGFVSTDGEVTWQEAALFAHQNLHKLRYDSERAFIEDMAISARHSPNHPPTERQLAWLFKIHRRLGGRS